MRITILNDSKTVQLQSESPQDLISMGRLTAKFKSADTRIDSKTGAASCNIEAAELVQFAIQLARAQ
jgi:hypothetical protein